MASLTAMMWSNRSWRQLSTIAPRHRFAKALERGPHSSHLQGPHGCRNLDSIFAVTVKDKKRELIQTETLPGLLYDP